MKLSHKQKVKRVDRLFEQLRDETAPNTKLCPRCPRTHNRRGSYCAECHSAYMKKWRRENPITDEERFKQRARSYAHDYLKRGLITKRPCGKCGTEDGRLEMHHPSYEHGACIRWMCRPCHREHHQDLSWFEDEPMADDKARLNEYLAAKAHKAETGFYPKGFVL